jgi:hypothetical protein
MLLRFAADECEGCSAERRFRYCHLLEIGGTGNGADKSLFDKDLNDEPAKTVNEIRNDVDSLWFDVDKIGSKLNLLGYITSFGKYRPYETGKLYPVTSVTGARKELVEYYTFRRDTIAQKEKMLLAMTIISSSLLPLILGVMGPARM